MVQAVQVGNHEDQMWFGDRVAVPVGRQQPMIDNNEEVDVAALQGRDELAQPEYPTEPSPPEEMLLEGEYGLYLEGTLLFKTTQESELRQVLEDAILNRNIPMDKLLVYRRVAIEFGIILG
jgi:hypothetical protein